MAPSSTVRTPYPVASWKSENAAHLHRGSSPGSHLVRAAACAILTVFVTTLTLAQPQSGAVAPAAKAADKGSGSIKDQARSVRAVRTDLPVQKPAKRGGVTVAGPAAVMVRSAMSGNYPAPIASMVERGRGVAVLDVFEVSGGLIGFVVSAANGEQRIYYVTPDGTTAIYGLAFDAQLKNLTPGHIASFTNPLNSRASVGTLAKPPAMSASAAVSLGLKSATDTTVASVAQQAPLDIWTIPGAAAGGQPTSLQGQAQAPAGQADRPEMLQAYNLVVKAKGAMIEGSGLPVFIVFDPACTFCHKTWRDTRALLGQLQIHWIPVGALGERSKLLAETFLRSTNKQTAMVALAQGKMPAAVAVTPEAASVLDENARILDVANVSNVPLLLYVDQGRVRSMVGAPSPAQLTELARAAAANASKT